MRPLFQDSLPFWESVAGPLNAGSFGSNKLENTFGPQVMFPKAPPEGQSNLPAPPPACSSSGSSASTARRAG